MTQELDLIMVIFLNSNNIWEVKVDLLRNLVHSSLPTECMDACNRSHGPLGMQLEYSMKQYGVQELF
jgi:hypothetical protein